MTLASQDVVLRLQGRKNGKALISFTTLEACARATGNDGAMTFLPSTSLMTHQDYRRGILRFVAALAEVQADAELIPAAGAGEIAGQCSREAERPCDSGFFDAAEVLDLLRKGIGESPNGARELIAWGANADDAADSALALQILAVDSQIASDRLRVQGALEVLTHVHRHSPMRDWAAGGSETMFGLKSAGWLESARDAGRELARAAARAARLQLGGQGGTLAGLDGRGIEISRSLALALGLPEAASPWHGRRERIAALVHAMLVQIGVMEAIASEIDSIFSPGEARSPIEADESIDPVTTAARGSGPWRQREWERLRDLVDRCVIATGETAARLEGLMADPARVQATLGTTLRLESEGPDGGPAASHVEPRSVAASLTAIESFIDRALATGRGS